MTLRPATAADVPTILRFIRLLAEYERLADEAVATEEGLCEELFGDRPAAEVVIAEIEGEPAGFALFFHNFSTFLGRRGLYLEDLFVLPEHRGKGIGRALLSHLAGIAVDRGYGRFEWSVLDWNEPAIGVYRRIGAVPLEEWTVQRLTGEALQKLAAERGAGVPARAPESQS
ncbi:GNAT family N-acetyltransferase [bacterium]|nr:MAG: GNAT family N-acetyltransferase [bacterium]